MKRAFTLIELLVVIAIIAILAAILFPVFAQAKEAAKKTAAISDIKQVGTSFVLYTADYDDTFPFAMIRDSAGAWAPNTVPDVPADWRSATAFVERHGVHWANSTFIYRKNQALLELRGLPKYTFSTSTPLKPKAVVGMTFNGLLHTYPATGVNEPSRLTLLWHGLGKLNYDGNATSQPQLRCLGGTTSCLFNPGGMPAPDVAANQFGHIYATPPTAAGGIQSAWTFGQGSIFVATDTSARYRRVGGNNNGAGTVNSVLDPMAEYLANAVPNGRYNCRLGTATTGYWCQMRPDFTFNFNDYN